MGLDFLSRAGTAVAVASALIVVGSGPGPGQRKGDAPVAAKGDSSRPERASGVIVRVEKVARAGPAGPKAGQGAEGEKGPAVLRLSINTNAVWGDWARDQARARDEGSPKADAARGAESVATKGQPADENSLVVVEVAPSTRVETRFRSPSDETSKGATAPEKVKPDGPATSKVAPAGKPVEFRAEDLLPGLFVEAEFRPSGPTGKNPASTVTVIRPIRALESSTATKSTPK